MSSHRARGNTSSGFNLQNECYFLDKTGFSAVFLVSMVYGQPSNQRSEGQRRVAAAGRDFIFSSDRKKRRLHFLPE